MKKLIEKYRRIRSRTLEICAPLAVEDHIPQPALFVSPPKWHLGHTTWFFETFIARELPDYSAYDEKFGFCFNSYYESFGARVTRDKRGFQSRPLLSEVIAYRKHIDEFMLRSMESGRGWNDQLRQLLMIGLNHEQQHQELLWYDIKYILANQALEPAYTADAQDGVDLVAHDVSWHAHEAALVTIGHSGKAFCYDNEQPEHRVFVEAFALRNTLVSQREWLAFVEDQGYANALLWTSDGWDWRRANAISAPLYWKKDPNLGWTHFTLRGREPIQAERAVQHISWYEAAAFCEWAGYRLPTEFEWEALSDRTSWGNLWEHSGSAYLPYPGYSSPQGAVGEYNGKFMINQMVMRGASFTTPEDHKRKSYRNFFHPEMRWHFSGLRLAKTL